MDGQGTLIHGRFESYSEPFFSMDVLCVSFLLRQRGRYTDKHTKDTAASCSTDDKKPSQQPHRDHSRTHIYGTPASSFNRKIAFWPP